MTALAWLGAIAGAAEVLQFGNGLRVVLDPDLPATRVSVAMTFAVGNVDEPAGEEGIAHVVEHLWFRTQDATGARTWDRLEAAGCEIGAWTASDRTDYVTTCPPEALDLLLERELARLVDPLAGIDELDRGHALAVVGHEELERAQSPWLQVLPHVFEALYPADHPLVARAARPQLAAPTLDALRRWTTGAYAPAHASLALTGRFDAQLVRTALIERFGPPRPAVFAAERRAVPSPRRTLRPAPRTVDVPVDHPALVLAWAPPRSATFAFQGPLLADLVSRVLFFRWLGRPEVISSSCEIIDDSLGSPLVCWVDLQDDAPVDALAAELRDLAAGLWSGRGGREIKQLFLAARSQYAVGVTLVRDDRSASPGGRAAWLAHGVHSWGVADPFAAAQADLGELDAKALLAEAEEHLDPQQALVLVVRPDGRPTPTLQPWAPPPPRLSSPVAPGQVAPAAVVAAERTLSNGLRVLAVQRTDSELLHAAFRVGRAVGPAPVSDVVDLLGSGDPPATLLLNVVPTDERDLGLSGSVHAVHGPAVDPGLVLDRLASRVHKVKLELFLMSPLLERQRAGWERETLDAATWAGALAVAGTDPTGEVRWRLSGRQFDDQLATTPIAAAHDLGARYSAGNLELVLVGPHRPEALIALAEERFAGWPVTTPSAESAADPSPTPLAVGPLVVVDDPVAARAALVFGCALPEHTSEAVSHVVRGAVSSELWQRLREDASLVYTPRASAIDWTADHATLAVWAEVPWDRAGEALLAVRAAIEVVAAGPADRLAHARAAALLDGPSRASPVETLRWALGGQRIRTAEELRGWSGAVGAVGAVEVAAALERCVAEGRAAFAGPGTATADVLLAAGLAPEVLTVDEARARVSALAP